ncbi:L-aspartate oxidase [Chloroflexota bacterium]
MSTYDYIIIGSGIAGLYTALLAQEEGSVLILTKSSIDDCNTKYAQGGIAAPIGKNDSPELHFQDTIVAGAGLCDPEAVRLMAEEATDRITDLIRFGVPFDTINGEVALTKEAAHALPRILHAGGDATGEHIEVTLSRRVRHSSVRVMEHCLAAEIVVEDGKVIGVNALDCRTGSTEQFNCRSLILTTGGAGRLFKYTTNSEIATGDGVALAYQAGAEITDIEFFQFHPTALRLPGVQPFLISEAVRGEGGILRNTEGYQFMPDYNPEGELAPRDMVARSTLYEMQKTHSDRVFLDVTHLSPHLVTTRFPHIYRFCLDHGLDITRGLIPVAPAAHYMMGGVKTNSWGETNIDGLYAVGEVACTGVHGANRLASNSLMEVLIFSKRIMQRSENGAVDNKSTGDIVKPCYYSIPRREISCDAPALSLITLQTLMWEKVGIIRSRETLEEAVNTLATWEKTLHKASDRSSYELNNLVQTARLMTEAALIREESRGAHFRTDYPQPSEEWLKHIILREG